MNYVALLLIGIVIGAAAMYVKPPGVTARSAPQWIMIPVPGQPQTDAAWKLNTANGDAYLCLLGSATQASCLKAANAATP